MMKAVSSSEGYGNEKDRTGSIVGAVFSFPYIRVCVIGK